MKKFKRVLICISVAVCMAFAAALSACIVGPGPGQGDVPNNEEGDTPVVPGEDEGTTPGGGTLTPDETPGGGTEVPGETPDETPGSGSDTPDETPGTEDGTQGGTEETPGGTDESPAVHEHSLERVDAVAATEGADGHTAYWYCEGCGKYYADSEASEEISLTDTVTHYLVHVEAQESTSVTTGNTEYWECANCHKYFRDAQGVEEIEDKTSVVIPVHATAVVVHVVLPSTVTIDSAYNAYSSETATIAGFTTDDTLTSANLPAGSELADSNDSEGYLAKKTFAGWYLKQANAETGAVTNSIIGSTAATGVSLSGTAEITVAPYYHIYGTSTTVANNRPGSGTVSYSNNGTTETWNGVASNATTADMGTKDHSWKCIVTQTTNKAVLDPATPGGYATVGTAARTDGITFTRGDKFRFTAAVSFDPAKDNVEIYRFQNYGPGTIKFKSCLTNTGTEIDTANTTNAVYIYLAPGETAEYVWSSEYGTGTNTSLMIDFEAEDAFTMNMGVSMAYVTSDSADHVNSTLTGIYSQLQTAGYNIGAADHNTTEGDISESNFVACLTSSTTYNGLTDTPVEAASLLTYEAIDLADASVKED